jgi:plasmid stabilization system protein ParE
MENAESNIKRKKAKPTKKCKDMVKSEAKYIKKNSPEQAKIFVKEFRETVDLIETLPGMGKLAKNGMKKMLLGKFRYNVYYKETEKNIIVFGIWHTSRGTDFEL